jgi:hypothetical protein
MYTFLFYGVLFFKAEIKPDLELSFLSQWLSIVPTRISGNYLILASIIMGYIQVVLFFGMIRKFGLTNDQSLISAYIYITLTGLYPGMIIISPASISFFILILAIYNLFRTYDIEFPLQKFFFVSLYIGISSLLYSPMCVFLVFLIIVLPALKTPSLREFLIIIIGFIIPFYFLGLYFFMTDQMGLYIQLILDNVPESLFYLDVIYQYYLPPLVFVGILFLMAFLRYFMQTGSRTIRIIMYNRILFTCVVISLIAYLIIPSNRWLIGPYVLAPASVYIGNMLADDSRRIFNQVAFSLLFLLAVYSEYIFYINS